MIWLCIENVPELAARGWIHSPGSWCEWSRVDVHGQLPSLFYWRKSSLPKSIIQVNSVVLMLHMDCNTILFVKPPNSLFVQVKSFCYKKTNHKESRKKNNLPYSSLWHCYLESVYPSGHTEYTHIHSSLRCVLCECNCVNNVARNVALRFLHVAYMLMASV